MPALITHHLFGEDVLAGLPAGLVEGEEELLAFLLGNQGPDPLLARFSTLPSRALACRRLAQEIQAGRVTRAFLSLRDGVSRLPAADERIGRAFVLGALGHYALDRSAHPFVTWQQRELVETDPSLAGAEREIHAIIESDIDSWILWEKRHATVEERPAESNLMRTERTERVAGALVSQTALSVFGIEVGASEFGGAVRDYERLYRAIDPAGRRLVRTAGAVERRFRDHSYAQSSAHRVRRTDDCPAANLACLPWTDPFTGARRTESFADLYDEARLFYPVLAEAFIRGNEARLRELVAGLNYAGEPDSDA